MGSKRKEIKGNAGKIRDILHTYPWTASQKLPKNYPLLLFWQIKSLLERPLSFVDFERRLSQFKKNLNWNYETAFNIFIKDIESPKRETVDKKTKSRPQISQRRGRSDVEDFRLVANLFRNRESKLYLSEKDRALISEKLFLVRKGINDEAQYICKIRGISYEKFRNDEKFKAVLFKENQWVERVINVLSYLFDKHIRKVAKERKKWVIEYFGDLCARWVPDWKEYIDAHPMSRHKGTFKKSLTQTLEYLKQGNIKCLGYTSKNKHHFEETHWVRGRIALLGQVHALLFAEHPEEEKEEGEEKYLERRRKQWRDKIRNFSERGETISLSGDHRIPLPRSSGKPLARLSEDLSSDYIP